MSDNQLPELNYIEFWKEEEVKITFRKICADLSGIIEKQKIQKQGMSIVSYFSKEDKECIRNQIISKIQDLHYNFIPTNNLHSTFLTITSKESFTKSNYLFIDLIKEEMEKFLQERKKKDSLSPIKLNFHEIRPGTWYGQDNYPIPYTSDGTVVAMGNMWQGENYKFVDLANQLVIHLKKYLRSIFNKNFERKFSTVWSTLGYFDHIDFDITKKFAGTFKEFKDQYSKQPLPIKIDKLSLVEFTYKDLSDGKILKEFEL